MTPTAAARASQPSAPSLRDRLKDSSLLREHCYIDGAWVGTPVHVPSPTRSTASNSRRCRSHEHRGSDAGGRSRRARISGLGETHRQAALQYPAQMVRADRRQPRGPGADPDLGAGQAAGRGARRSRYRRRLCRILRRGGAPRLWRNHSDPAGGCAAARDQAADRRLRRDHAVELSEFDDHPQGVAGAGRRLHRGAQARQRNAASALALAALAEKAGVPKGVFNIITGNSSAIGKVLCEHPAVRFVGFTGLDRGRQDSLPAGRRSA